MSYYWEAGEVAEDRGQVGELRQVVHESCCRVLDALQRLDHGGSGGNILLFKILDGDQVSTSSFHNLAQ